MEERVVVYIIIGLEEIWIIFCFIKGYLFKSLGLVVFCVLWIIWGIVVYWFFLELIEM